MQDLVDFIVKQIVSKPEVAEVEETHQDGMVNLSLKVDPVDMGLVIGKKGQTIKAIRKLLTVRAMAENVRVNLQLIDDGRAQTSESDQSTAGPAVGGGLPTASEDETAEDSDESRESREQRS